MKTKRSKATDIPQSVKDAVWERDNHRCVICGSPIAMPNAHYISRANGGLGIEQNIVTLCTAFGNGCHHRYDNGTKVERERIKKYLAGYLRTRYEDWNEENLIYRKEK